FQKNKVGPGELEGPAANISPTPEMEDTVDFQITYPEGVMEALDEHADALFDVLKQFPNIDCISGFDKLSPETRFLYDEDKDFFTGNRPSIRNNRFNVLRK